MNRCISGEDQQVYSALLQAMSIVLKTWHDQFNKLKESGNIRDEKAWLMQFVSRIELGYNKARIFYTYPMIDLLPDGFSRISLPQLGGIGFPETANRSC